MEEVDDDDHHLQFLQFCKVSDGVSEELVTEVRIFQLQFPWASPGQANVFGLSSGAYWLY